VIVKHYIGFENHAYQPITISQVRSARANGCSHGAYVWGFQGYSPERTVDDAVAISARAGYKLSLVALDCETYNDGNYKDDGPHYAWIQRFETYSKSLGVEPWIYTGRWWWGDGTANWPGVTDLHGTSDFNHLGLWDSNYNGIPTLVPAKYGGWAGNTQATQWWDKPYDQSRINSAYARI
jgi:hypothetical protein